MLFIPWSIFALLAAADLRFHRIPKSLNFSAICLLLIFDPRLSVPAIGIWILYILLCRLSRNGIGYGDVRLASITLIALVGEHYSISAIALPHIFAWIFGGLFVVLRRDIQGNRLPFAPFLALGTHWFQAGSH